MTESYNAEDLRIARQRKHNGLPCSMDNPRFICHACQQDLDLIAAVRREMTEDPCGKFLGLPLAEVQAALIYYDKRPERDKLAEALRELTEYVKAGARDAEAKLWVETLEGKRDAQSDYRVNVIERVKAAARLEASIEELESYGKHSTGCSVGAMCCVCERLSDLKHKRDALTAAAKQ